MKLTMILVTMCATVLIGGCAKPTDCWASPIRPSVDDALTDGTARQILAHNEAGRAICGWKP